MKQLAVALIGLFGLAAATPALAAKTDALLAVSWQPAFCEGHSGRAECKSQSADRYEASHFSLHGLWPMNKEYCGVSDAERATDEAGEWSKLPALSLSADLKSKLQKVMPGMQSDLQRHEWIKHGTCTRFSPENYYQASVELLHQLNGSAVADLFRSHIGQQLSSDAITKSFDSAFGRNAGRRIKVSCVNDGNRVLIDEITIGLSKQYAPGTSLEDLIQGAGSTTIGCEGGIVDPAGLQ